MNVNQSWDEYYKRIANDPKSIAKFRDKYQPFFSLIVAHFSGEYILKEEGCGTGLVSALLCSEWIRPTKLILSDLSPQMLAMVYANTIHKNMLENPPFFTVLMIEDITEGHRVLCPEYGKVNVVTHGVLEHFSDEQLDNLIKKYNRTPSVMYSAHYVPLNGYKTKSFGDERLESAQFWLDKFQPIDWLERRGEDLFFICKHH